MSTIVAVGGGNLGRYGTLSIDRHIVGLTGKKRPRALFLPTANSDSESDWLTFNKVYGKRIGCRTDVLQLITCRPPKRELSRMIRTAELIYVGGGYTLQMLKLWRRLGVDKLLLEAWKNGTVMSGISAGAVCWFNYGHSDSMSLYSQDDWSYVRVRGLGMIDATACPHFDGPKRDQRFREMIRKRGGLGIALDNNCAIEVVDDKYRILTSKRKARAYRVFKQDGEVITEQIVRKQKRTPLSELTTR